MFTVVPRQFVNGMRIRKITKDNPTENSWVTLSEVDINLPIFDDGNHTESGVFFRTEYGIGVYRYTSEQRFEIDPNSAHLL